MKENLKNNWYWPISAVAFLSLGATFSLGYFLSILIALAISVIIAARVPSIWKYISTESYKVKIFSFFTAIGICLSNQQFFYKNWSVTSKVQSLQEILPISIDITKYISMVGFIVGLLFVYVCVVVFWKKMLLIFKETKLFCDLKTKEIIVYVALLFASFVLVTFAFIKTDAFYGSEYAYDVIYTSDSSSLVNGNAYLSFTHLENDLRQPLFAVFAAPFVGIPYLIGNIFSLSMQALLMNYVQILLLFTACFMLTKMMKLNYIKRICFMILMCCSYTYLLFILMMEQYIISFFWLIFLLYLICENKQPNRIGLWGAGGTLLTSLFFVLFMSEKSPIKNFKQWFFDIMRYGLEFIVVILAFCRFDIIFNLSTKITLLNNFTGKDLTLGDKFFQYTDFVRNCFFAPSAGVNSVINGYASWQLNPITTINYVGIIIILLAIFSAILNKNNKCSLLATCWIGISMIMFVGLGWGTNENGLILYSLYFGWPFFILLFQLVEKIENKLRLTFLLPIICLVCASVMIVINIPAILEVIEFAIEYYPLN